MPAKDFYKVLGVAESASADEIKKAYRKLAKKNHPDATGGDKSKEARFKEITEANETLSDPKKRAAYDEQRKNPFAGGGYPGGAGFPGGGAPGQGPFGGGINVDLEDLLRQMGQQRGRGGRGSPGANPFGGGGGMGDIFGDMFSGGGGRAQPRKGEDVVARLDIDLIDAALGAEKVITVDGKKLNVKIPAGITDGKTIRLAGQGNPGGRGAPPGDLLIELHERPSPSFRRKAPGSPDIEVELPVPVDVAILGGKAEVKTMEGTTISLTIPPGTSSGRQMRVKGKGAHIPGGHDGARGDLYATASVRVPSEIPERARELIQEFAKLTSKPK